MTFAQLADNPFLAILAIAGLAWSGYRQRRDMERRINRRIAEYARRRERGRSPTPGRSRPAKTSRRRHRPRLGRPAR